MEQSSQNRARSSGSVMSDDDLDQEQLAKFNRGLIRDNEKMLEEIDDLRDENDELRDAVDKLRREVAIQRRVISDHESTREGQSDAWMLLQQEIEKEEAITSQLQSVFDTLSSHRFDNLFIKMASERHAALGGDRALTKNENKDIAKTALIESGRQLDNVQGIVESMALIPNFHSNPKDIIILDAITQIISLSRVMNQTVVAKCATTPSVTPAPATAQSAASSSSAMDEKKKNRSPVRRFFGSFGRKKKESDGKGSSSDLKRTESGASNASGSAKVVAGTASTTAHFDFCEEVKPEGDAIEELVKGLLTARRPATQPSVSPAPAYRVDSNAPTSAQNSARCNPTLSPSPNPTHAHPTHPHSLYHVEDATTNHHPHHHTTVNLPQDRREQPLTARGVAGRAELLQTLGDVFQTPGDQTARRMEQQQLAATLPRNRSRGSMSANGNHSDPNAQTYS